MNPRYFRYYTYIKPIVKNKAVQTYTPFVFSILAIIIFGIFAIRPTIGTIIGLQRSISEQQQIYDQLKIKAENLSEGKRNYQNLNPQTKQKLDNLLPDQTDLPNLIADLTSLTNNLEASISGLQIQPVELTGMPTQYNKDAQLQEITFTYNVVGGYPVFNEILKRIELSKRLIAIDSVNMNRTSDDSLIMSINAKSYFLKN